MMTKEMQSENTELIEVTYTADLDRDDLEAYIEEEHPDADHVKVNDRNTGRWLESRGKRPQYICPGCGEEANSITSSGGKRVYSHGGDDKCTVKREGYEEEEHSIEEVAWWKSALSDVLPTLLGLGITAAVTWVVIQLLPRSTMAINGEAAPFPPANFEEVLIAFFLLALVIIFALKYAPATGGRR